MRRREWTRSSALGSFMLAASSPMLALWLLVLSFASPSLVNRARGTSADDESVLRRAQSVLAPRGIEAPELSRLALGTFLEAQDAYRACDFDACARTLDALWRRAPPGAEAWAALPSQPGGANFGTPTCYYALRMLGECVAWRRQQAAQAGRTSTERVRARPIVLCVVLAGHSSGVSPRTNGELEANGGVALAHDLDPALLANDGALVHESLELLREYALAITGGRLSIDVRIVALPELRLNVETRAGSVRTCGLAPEALDVVWAKLDASTRSTSDWWWLLYPSHVPETCPDFATTEFVTGGMASAPNGGPCFVIDDRWLVRKPPHLGRGPYSDGERRAYLPQWLQHELFHHLFHEYAELGLERESHQWFRRATWPDDFEGRFEADYYAQALEKRLRTPRARPRLDLVLRYAAPPAEVLRKLTPAAFEGEYERRPIENDWHRVTLKRTGTNELQWKNAAQARWRVEWDAQRGVLAIGADSPYFDREHPQRNELTIVPRRADDGAALAEVVGLRQGPDVWWRTTK